MATTILHKRKSGIPVVGDFVQGQLIINTANGTISFLKSDNTTIVTLSTANCQITNLGIR